MGDRGELDAVLARNRRQYALQVAGEASPGWDYCVLTASSERQAPIYEAEIARRRRAGWLPPGTELLVVPDPGGRRIGSGAAACYALRRVLERWHTAAGRVRIEDLRVLVINSGGDSRRIPHCAALGKAFSDLPIRLMPGGPRSTVFDELMVSCSGLPGRVPGGCVVLSGDVVLAFDPAQFVAGSGVTGLGCRVPWEVGLRHGVYVAPSGGGAVQAYLQKPTRAQLEEAGALVGVQVLVDTGLLFFDAPSILRLAELAGVRLVGREPEFGPGLLDMPGLESASIDLYDHVCLALTHHPPAPGAAPPTTQDQVRQAVRESVDGVGFSVAVPDPGHFVHLGTTRQYLAFCMDTHRGSGPYPPESEAEGPCTRRASVWTPGSVVGSLTGSGTGVVDHCSLSECTLRADAVVSMVEHTAGLVVPEGLVVQHLPLAGREAGSRSYVVLAYGVGDDPKAEYPSPDCALAGTPLEKWLARRAIRPEDLWPSPGRDDRSLWTARLFVPGGRAESLRRSLWLLEEAPSAVAVDEWRAAPRLSMQEATAQADLGEVAQWRASLRSRRLGQDIADALPCDGSLASLFGLVVHEADARAAFSAILSYIRDEPNPLCQARAYKALSDLTGDPRVLHRLGQLPSVWDPAALLAQNGGPGAQFPGPVPREPGEASAWFEDMAFSMVRRAVAAGVAELEVSARHWPPVGTHATVRAPVRLDFGGGWSDTPPFSLERGGAVLNAALLLDGEYPITVSAEVTAEPVVELVSVDGGAREVVVDRAGLLQCDQLDDPLALHKAVLAVSAPGAGAPQADPGGPPIGSDAGLRLVSDVGVPQGSGLGTSSIVAAALLSCLDALLGRHAEPDDICTRVLYVEQLVTAGGGWQDQLGGLYPGVKLLETEPGYRQVPRVSPLALTPAALAELEERLLVCFTGQRRIAKRILREIVSKWLSREPEVVGILAEIKDVARAMSRTLTSGDFDAFGHLMAHHWELNKRLDHHSTTDFVDRLLGAVADLTVGAKLAGAGGGGFAMLLARDRDSAHEIRRRLTPLLDAQGGRFYGFSLSATGLVQAAGRPRQA
jgi:fucokinase / fucose-1-phosphate guanylyltransferase